MTEVAPKPQGLFAKLGFRPRKEKESSSRKLVRKNDRRHASVPEEPVHRSASVDFWEAPGAFFENAHRSASIPTPRNRVFEEPDPRHDSVSTSRAAPRKLSKLPHQVPQQRMDDVLDKDTGERKDLTDMMHAFNYHEESDEVSHVSEADVIEYDYSRLDGATLLARASPELWLLISDYLSPIDIANLASTCRTMHLRLGNLPYQVLRDPANRAYRLEYLLPFDSKLPNHLFCFPCAQWHRRTQPGYETIKPSNVLNPLFRCPNATNVHLPPPRLRISEGRQLPFTFVQLAKRHWEHGPAYGIPVQSLARRWKDMSSAWSHQTMYHIQSNGQ